MKRIVSIFLLICLGISLCACSSEVVLREDQKVTMTFRYEYKNIKRALNEEESAEIIKIFNGKYCFDVANENPSCGYDDDVALTVGKTTFAIARDGCHTAMNMSTREIILLTEDEYDYILMLYDTYGGFFPCMN